MRSFLQRHRPTGALRDATEGIRYQVTPCYYEFELPSPEGEFVIVYLMRHGEHSYRVYACMPDAVALAANSYAEMDARTRRATLPVYRAVWPLLMQLYSNGVEHMYSPAALTVINDPDDGVDRWAVATVVGNLNPVAADEVLSNPRLRDAMLGISGLCAAVIHQVTTSTPDADRLANSRMWSDVRHGLSVVGRFFDRNASPAVDLLEFFAKS